MYFFFDDVINILVFLKIHCSLISARLCQKDAFYAHLILFVLSQQFGNSYWRLGDSVCKRKTPG